MADFQGFDGRLNMASFTSLPNSFFDSVLPEIKSLSELKVLLAVFRKTYGWISHIDPETGQPVYKEVDQISMSQFKELTGLSQPSCVDGVKRAVEDGYLERVKEGTFHGGNSIHNESAAYRIKQKTTKDSIPPQTPKQKVKDTNKEINKEIKEILETPKGKTIKKESHGKQLDMDFTDNTDTEKTNPSDLLAEFFPPQNEEPAPKKKEPKSFKTKKPSQWNANDLLAYFNTQYKSLLGFSAGPITMKHKSLSKKLLEGYETENVTKAIDYYLANYKTISYLPSGHPAFNIFFGYRQSLIPEALDPLSAKKSSGGGSNKQMREFEEEKKAQDDNDDGGYVW
jgi:hypothetical protein